MDKTIPLVVYKDGERHVIGRTTIHECDGALTFVAEVDDNDAARSLLPTIHMNEFSVRRPIVPLEWLDPNPPPIRRFLWPMDKKEGNPNDG